MSVDCRATLDGPDGWMRGWYCMEDPRPERIRRQQGGGGVMFWAAIIGNELVGPFRVSDEVKMTAKVYMDFLKKHLLKKKWAFRKNMVFVHDNAPSHAARPTTKYLNSVNFCQTWKSHVMASLLSRSKSYRKFLWDLNLD